MDTPELIAQPRSGGSRSPVLQLVLGFVFGLAFGFLLQKGGVAKFHILVGVLLFTDWTVIQVMLSAIAVGMAGIYAMKWSGLIKLQPKRTRYAANVIGGLVFGAGFALAAYCPGTNAAALGQGNYDALAVVVGLIAGSWVFAETSGWAAKHLDPLGDRGMVTLPDWLPWPPHVVVLVVWVLLIAALVAIEWIPTLPQPVGTAGQIFTSP